MQMSYYLLGNHMINSFWIPSAESRIIKHDCDGWDADTGFSDTGQVINQPVEIDTTNFWWIKCWILFNTIMQSAIHFKQVTLTSWPCRVVTKANMVVAAWKWNSRPIHIHDIASNKRKCCALTTDFHVWNFIRCFHDLCWQTQQCLVIPYLKLIVPMLRQLADGSKTFLFTW